MSTTIEAVQLPGEKLLFSESDLDALGVLSRKTRWRLRREERFPEPISASPGRKLYRRRDVERWLANPEGWGREPKSA